MRLAGKAADHLAVPIYSNQKTVFDLLAVLEDGLSQLKNIKTSTGESDKGKGDLGGELGAPEVFAFLSVKLKESTSTETATDTKREITEERTFAPSALFSKLRTYLLDHRLLRSLDDSKTIAALAPGQFIEFTGVPRKNPLVAAIESMIRRRSGGEGR